MKKPWQTGFVSVVVTLDEARRLKASLSRHFELPFRLWHVLVPTKINGLGDILISSRTRPSLTLWIETKNFGIVSLCFNRQPSKVAHLHPVAIGNAAPCRQVHLNESSERKTDRWMLENQFRDYQERWKPAICNFSEKFDRFISVEILGHLRLRFSSLLYACFLRDTYFVKTRGIHRVCRILNTQTIFDRTIGIYISYSTLTFVKQIRLCDSEWSVDLNNHVETPTGFWRQLWPSLVRRK